MSDEMTRALLADKVQKDFGLQPNIQRGAILPLPTRNDQGQIDWTNWRAPQWVYEGASALALPAHVAEGGQYDMGDVTNMGLALMGGASIVPAKKGAIRMGSMVNEDAMMDLLKPKGMSKLVGSETGKFVDNGISIFKSPYGSTRFVKTINGKPVGVVQVMGDLGKEGTISNAYVIPEYQRQGIGSEILNLAKKSYKNFSHSKDQTDIAKAWSMKNE